MTITPQMVEAAAPDQASLKAAVKLMKPASWSGFGAQEAPPLFWADCQGSGAAPYRVAVDGRDLGAKCSCPSRKFPCKHALALMLFRAQGQVFSTATPPDWVNEWLSRRRAPAGEAGAGARASGTPSRPGAPQGGLAAAMAEAAAPEAAADPAAEARRAEAKEKREQDTAASLRAGLAEMEGWIADQLRGGLPGFLSAAAARCRTMAARLVDAKAQALAARLDEAPARLAALPAALRAEAALAEFSRLILLSRAYRAEDAPPPGVHRAIFRAETREALLEDPAALRVASVWEALAARERLGRDGLIARESWLMNRGEAGPRFALLLDHFPKSAARGAPPFAPGALIEAALVFHPDAAPLRAALIERAPARPWGAAPPAAPRPLAPEDPLEAWRATLAAAPWREVQPLLLPPGRLARDAAGAAWWQGENTALPLGPGPIPPAAFGMALTGGVALWDGFRAEPLALFSAAGRVGFHD